MAASPRRPVPPEVVIDPPAGFPLPDLARTWRANRVTLALVRRRVLVRYKHTAIGIAWVLLQPLLLTAAFLLVFDLIMFYLHNDLARIGLYPLIGE
jgi:ABC-type polysaccharide/polyol phosphate export permease